MQLKMTENLKVNKGGQFKVHPHLFGSGFTVKFYGEMKDDGSLTTQLQ